MNSSWLRELVFWINAGACLVAWLALHAGNARGTRVAFAYADTLWVIYAGGMTLLTLLRLVGYRFPIVPWGIPILSTVIIATVGYLTCRYHGFREINVPFLLVMILGVVLTFYQMQRPYTR